ncbi:hypothetical protein BGW38_010758 [Lunasporangiospora selenospora]|uniref:Uncharacterized protein n=1 Tax=Lunasporangiospora selenospora TaxID=979761 RepID=A0A9P6FXZ9_9FUNG|nr:hypothetical protein BGW38_010758 [Lunasporangiospora selenospora]
MAGHNMCQVMRAQIKSQQRPDYLQPVDKDGNYPCRRKRKASATKEDSAKKVRLAEAVGRVDSEDTTCTIPPMRGFLGPLSRDLARISSLSTMAVRIINPAHEVLQFGSTQEAYSYVLSLDPPMSFRTDAPEPVCIPIDPESSPDQLTPRTYAILPLTENEKLAIKAKLHQMVSQLQESGGIPGLDGPDADLIAALVQGSDNNQTEETPEEKSKQ